MNAHIRRRQTHTTVTHRSNGKSDESEGPNVFAVIGLGGTQFKVMEGDVVITNKLPGVQVGSTFDVDKVLMIGSQDRTVVGRPSVEGAKVTLACEEQTKAAHQIVFKKKRRQGYQRKKGFRREITVSRVVGVEPGSAL